ncbi:MAG: enoyl-CoA hydratase/isomerase family protein [Actinobacteria bacterium]|nr:enoyl-CoA hydratase/isomerase family protein [Actinomycetota bacterium]
MGEFVRLAVEGGVGTIRLDRPPANAISEQVSRELRDAALEAGERDDVRAVVICMAEFTPEQIRPVVSALGDALIVVEEIPKVTIAAINGYALGGGCELALAADLRYAAEDAQFGQPEIALGIIPGAGGTQRLPRLVGLSRAKELVYSGRRVGAEEALALGLVDRVLPAAEVYVRAVEDAARYARGPTAALAAAKEALNSVALGDLRKGLGVERDVFCGLFATDDQKEGMRAFLEKRGPDFKGR